MLRRPRSSGAKFPVDSRRVPIVFTITKQVVPRRVILNRIEQKLHRIGRRWIRHVLVVRKIWTSPRCTLMREGEWFVIMKVVDDIRIRIRLEKEHLVKSGPAMAAGNDRVIRCACSNRRDQFSLYAVPTIPILD